MQEVQSKENPLGLTLFINGVPDFSSISKRNAKSIIAALEVEISNFYEKKNVIVGYSQDGKLLKIR